MENWKITDYESFLENILEINSEEIETINKELDSDFLYNEITMLTNSYKKERTVYSIDKDSLVYKCQNNIEKNFFNKVFFSSCAFGFIKSKSYFDYLSYHSSIGSNTFYLRLDVKNFFDSIQVSDFVECLQYYIDDECPEVEKNKIIKLFIRIVTYKNHFVQGVITSPDISNLVFRSLDIRICNYCNKLGIKYSRYADDLLFSSNNDYLHSKRFIKMIKSIIASKGFELNYDKILKQQNKLVINGYVVSDTINPSRKKLSSINKILFEIKNNKRITKTSWGAVDYHLLNYICGYRCHLIQVSRYCDDNHKKKLSKIINRIEDVVDCYF